MKHRVKQIVVPILAAIVVVCGMGAGVAAQSGGLPDWGSGGTGTLKAGPLGLNGLPSAEAQMPVAMVIADADVDADVEVRTMADGVMQDPSGPWVVSWYDFSALAGSDSNSVFAGHVDYWGVGPSVLRNVADLGNGAEIVVTGEDGTVFTYSVEEVYRVNAFELSAEDLDNIIGPTDYSALTIITCGGEFDGTHYLQRDIVRARLVDSSSGAVTTANDTADNETASGSFEIGATATVSGDGVNVRAEPSTSAEILTTSAAGDIVTITDESQGADGYVWWPIETADGTSGWIAEEFLQA